MSLSLQSKLHRLNHPSATGNPDPLAQLLNKQLGDL